MECGKGPFEILYQDDDLVAIDKPAGFHVHPPENRDARVPRTRICLSMLRAQVRRYVYPIHRLDVATLGVCVWALNPEAASALNKSFREHEAAKSYQAVVRGFVEDEFAVELPLESDSTRASASGPHKDFRLESRLELDVAVGKKFPKARYSWVHAFPRTGRFHQIRRHLNRVSRPILGDCEHGDSHHNRFFRESLGIPGLCLRAFALELPHPRTRAPLRIEAPVNEHWEKIANLFRSGPAPF